jgi:hypothetical protein
MLSVLLYEIINKEIVEIYSSILIFKEFGNWYDWLLFSVFRTELKNTLTMSVNRNTNGYVLRGKQKKMQKELIVHVPQLKS